MRDGLTIEFPTGGTNDQRRTKIAALAEGIVGLNAVELESGSEISLEGVKYEDPREGRKGQLVGSMLTVMRRGKATCIEVCCIVCAIERAQGRHCYVQVLSTKYRDKVRPFVFHAVVRYPDGTTFDASDLLDGYQRAGEWWARLGHCCPSCAVDEPCQGDCSCGGNH